MLKMIDSIVQVDSFKLRIESTIAEGGFGYVYKAIDTETNLTYALKKINSHDQESLEDIKNEIDILKSLQKHAHIMEFIASSSIDHDAILNGQPKPSWSKTFRYTYYILTEYCELGCLSDLNIPIQELERSCRIIYQITLALEHMHKLGIVHRDIKAENILFDKNGKVKLCDFGSSTRKMYEPTIFWTAEQRRAVEEEAERHTTPLYRPPEILDTYTHFHINCAIDIWELGCLIYYMRFGQHAFPDSGRLSKINCSYIIPKGVPEDDPLVSLIRQCLKSDPVDRISVTSLIASLEIEFYDMDLNGDIVPFTPSVKKTSTIPKQQLHQEQKQQPTLPPIPSELEQPQSQQLLDSDIEKLSKVSSPKEDTLIDLANSPSSIETPRTSHQLNLKEEPAKKAGVPIELMAQEIDNILDLGNVVISDQKVLSPKKATIAPRSSSNNNKRDAFDDLLESFGTPLPSNGSNFTQNTVLADSINSYDDFGACPMLRIHEWKESRRGNIRSLLSSLHTVLSDDFKWKAIGMHQLVTDSDVKKVYRQACLAIHPDKVTSNDEETKEIAKIIFMELNEAWSKFDGK